MQHPDAPMKSIIDGLYWHAYCAMRESEPVERTRRPGPGIDCEGCGHEF